MSKYHALVRGIPPTTCSKHQNGNNQPSAHSNILISYRHTSGNIFGHQCTQLHDLCKLCIQQVTTVFANCTEWLHHPDSYTWASVHAQMSNYMCTPFSFHLGCSQPQQERATKRKSATLENIVVQVLRKIILCHFEGKLTAISGTLKYQHFKHPTLAMKSKVIPLKMSVSLPRNSLGFN